MCTNHGSYEPWFGLSQQQKQTNHKEYLVNNEIHAVWKVYKPFKRFILISLIGLTIGQFCSFGYQVIMGKALDSLVKEADLQMFAWLCGGLVVINLIHGWVMQYRENSELRNLDYDLKRSMRRTTSQKMLSLSLGQHHSEHSGIKQRIVSEGENSIVTVFNSMVFEVLPFALEVTICAIGCFFFDPMLGSVVILSTVLTFLLSKRHTDVYGPQIIKQDKSDDKTTKLAREIVQHVDLIKLNGKERFAVDEQDRMLDQVSQGWKSIWVPFNNALWNAALFPRMMRIVVLFVAGLRAYNGDITFGTAFILWRLSDSAIGRLGTISYLLRMWKMHTPRIKRYVQFLSLVPDIETSPNALRVPRFMGEIEFSNVSFRYPTKRLLESEDDKLLKAPERELAIEDVSISLDPGRSYAIVGVSGSGKTTLKHLMVRSYDPTMGVIKFDGYPLAQLDLELLRSRIGVVDQEVPLLDRTLRENLIYLLPEGTQVSEEEIWRACRMANIDKFAHRLEHGLDTLIGERGVKLSGGERQRVAIARAILKNPDILIFDEATSSLDALNEDDIVRAIKDASKGKTAIMIAHRFSTILSADEIVVMDKGRVVGRGTHKELYRSCPAYQRLVGPQIRTVEPLLTV